MKSLIKILFLFSPLFLILGCSGSSESIDTENIVISVNKDSIQADKSEKVTFTVLYKNKDVTSESEIWNQTANMKINGNTFTTTTVGNYSFYARYKNVKSVNTSNVSVYIPKIVISADVSSIKADGKSKVTFTVKCNDKDVTSSAEIWNKTKNIKLDGNTFSSSEIGNFVFYAQYDGRNTDNNLSIQVLGNYAHNFYTRVCVMDFTATWCQFCPYMMSALAKAVQDYSDRILVLAIHDSSSDLHSGDNSVYSLFNDFTVDGIPTGLYNFRNKLESYSSSYVLSALKQEVQNNSAMTGIAVSTKVNSDNNIEVVAKMSTHETNNYKLTMCLVEDNIKNRQNEGGTYTSNFVHNNIPLKFYPEPYGFDLGSVKADEEKSISHTFTNKELSTVRTNMKLSTTLDYANCRVVVYVSRKSGNKYYIDNTVSCPAKNGSVDYKYE